MWRYLVFDLFCLIRLIRGTGYTGILWAGVVTCVVNSGFNDWNDFSY